MNKSETIGELAKALASAQSKMGGAKKGASNPFFKSSYADLASVMEAIREPLSACGLSYVQTTRVGEGSGIIVETTLMHSSGEWISGELFVPSTKNDPQSFGSALSYGRRYALQAIVGLEAVDDDAEAAQGRGQDNPKKGRNKPSESPQTGPSLYPGIIETFSKIDNLVHLGNHFKSHYAEYQKDPNFQKIIEAKDKRKAELMEEEGKAA